MGTTRCLLTLAIVLLASGTSAETEKPATNRQFAAIETVGPSAESTASRLRHQISRQPENALLYFQLGVLLSQEAHWPQARQAFARALALAPGKPDLHHNLAVSLDHLEQTAEAIHHYRQALAASATLPHGFAPSAAHTRLNELLGIQP